MATTRLRTLSVAVSTLALASAGTVLVTAPATAHEPGEDRSHEFEFETDLTGAGGGDPDGSGEAEVSIAARSRDGMTRLCWEIEVEDIADPTRAHIHAGAAGVNGPIVVAFFDAPQPPALEGCTLVASDLARQIRQQPDQFYVNVHNADFLAGAVRGQLQLDD